MILRDPPGGDSFATYDNVKSTLRVVESETTTNINAKVMVKPSGVVKMRSKVCAGGGFGALVLACSSIATGKTDVGIEVATEIG